MSRACFKSALLTLTYGIQFFGLGSDYSECQGGPSPSDEQAACSNKSKISASPLDSLQRDAIPANEKYPWQPAELVAVIGTHRGMHFGWVTSISYRPDGKTIASAGVDGVIRFWDSQLREVGSLKSDGVVANSLAFSGNGKWVAAARRDGSVRLWRTSSPGDVPTEQSRSLLLKVDAEVVETVALSPDGRLLACDEGGKIRIWTLDEGGTKDYALLDAPLVGRALFSPDGKYLVSARKYDEILLWDIMQRTPALCATLSVDKDQICDIAFSHDGTILGCVSAEGRLRLWSISGGRPEKLAVIKSSEDTFVSIEFVLGDAMVATGNLAGELALWEIKGDDRRTAVWRKKIGYAICDLTCAPGGKALAAVSRDDGSIQIWDVTRGAAELRCPERTPVVTCTIAWLADSGRIICGRTDGKLEIWELAKAVPEKLEEFGIDGDTIWSLAISPKGDMIA